jgi:hypothetical protein
MMRVTKEAMDETLEIVDYDPTGWSTGCSDLGDVSMVMPAVHPYIGGAVGRGHGAAYFITDVYTATVDSARVQANMLVKLLENDGQRVETIKANFKAPFRSKEAFFQCIDDLTMDQQAVSYNEDGTVTLKYMK